MVPMLSMEYGAFELFWRVRCFGYAAHMCVEDDVARRT